MDLGAFSDEVRDAVIGTCGDAIVETHRQAASVVEVLCRRPGADLRVLAAVFGVSYEQFERAREATRDPGEQERPMWRSMCQSDAVYTWNVLIERVNQAAHWREEFREMRFDAEEGGASCSEDADDAGSTVGGAEPALDGEAGGASTGPALASEATRGKTKLLISRHLEAATSEGLKSQLSSRLDDEIAEKCPDEKEYRFCARAIIANFRRNERLAAGYAGGRIPPQWIVLAGHEALAPAMQQMKRQVLRAENIKESLQDLDVAKCKEQMWKAGKGTGLQTADNQEIVF